MWVLFSSFFAAVAAVALWFIRRVYEPKEFVYDLKTFDALYPQPDGELAHPRWRGRLPPVFLNGWHLIGWVDDFKPGTVKQVRLHSKDYVLFRGEDGEFGLLYRYCPHMGADLGTLGEVCGSSLRCGFHHWEFDKNGKCTNIPYSSGRIPEQANIKTFPLKIFNRAIFTWWDAELRAPWFPIDDPAVPHIPADYNYEGKVVYHLRCHVMDVKENLPDVAHLNTLHKPHSFAFLRALARYVDLPNRWEATWEPHPEKSHISTAVIKNFIGKDAQAPVSEQHVFAIGPGLGISEPHGGFVMQGTTVIDPFHVVLEARFFGPNTFARRFTSKMLITAYHNQTYQDVPMWHTKRYLEKQVLVQGDGPIAAFRRWTSVFLSEHSPTYESIRNGQSDLDW
jgi:phenylpropionate dioxygenase-like ring-hydroxylating dioxygenase large terminal subunit